MPIETAVPIRAADRQEFYDLDFEMMRHALEIHSEYGGVLEEAIYKNELTLRCNAVGLNMEREVLVRVRHGGFTKDYRIDLLMKRGVIVEGKTAERIVPAHRGQTANYLMLADIRFGSLINFQGPSAKREFVTALQDLEERRRFEVSTARWPRDEQHAKLHDIAIAFARDIGLSLDAPLYRSAFTFLLGGIAMNPAKVPIYSADVVLGVFAELSGPRGEGGVKLRDGSEHTFCIGVGIGRTLEGRAQRAGGWRLGEQVFVCGHRSGGGGANAVSSLRAALPAV